MSLFLLNQLRCCRSRTALPNYYYLSSTIRCRSSTRDDSHNGGSDRGGGGDELGSTIVRNAGGQATLGQTVILVQQGTEIQELPVIMRRFGKDDVMSLCSNTIHIDGMATSSNASYHTTHEHFTAATTVDGDENGNEAPVNPVTDPDCIIQQLDVCQTIGEMFAVIDTVPDNELSPDIIVFTMDKVMRLDTLEALKQMEDSNETYEKLLLGLCKKAGNRTLLDSLNHFSLYLSMARTIDHICSELLIRSADGCLDMIEICESIDAFIACKRFADAEKFWSGISDQEQQINTSNIKFGYEVLPKIKVSRRMVLGVLERRIMNIYSQLSPDAVCQIVEALKECKAAGSPRSLRSISAWLILNIHTVSETQLEMIVRALTQLNYTDKQIENSLERYVKAKATKIKAQTLVVEILRHVSRFRLLNTYILNGCSEYMIMNAGIIEPGYLRDMLQPYGMLHYQPLNSQNFWKMIETFLHQHFHRITPRHVIDIMLNCVYLEVYPVNFVDRIFNPYFLDLIHSQTPMEYLGVMRNDLKIFDTAMTLECSGYKGPMLPRDVHARPLWTDFRIRRIVNDITDQLAIVAGGEDRFSKMTVPQQLPFSATYLIDVLFHPPGLGRFWNFNTFQDRNVYAAALIHLPEHYDSSGQYLMGPQMMRIRHMRSIGLKVITLKHDILARLRIHRKELNEYLVERMRDALPAKSLNNN